MITSGGTIRWASPDSRVAIGGPVLAAWAAAAAVAPLTAGLLCASVCICIVECPSDCECQLNEARQVARVGAARLRQIDVDDAADLARPRGHHHDPIREDDRFVDAVGDEHDGRAGLAQDP